METIYVSSCLFRKDRPLMGRHLTVGKIDSKVFGIKKVFFKADFRVVKEWFEMMLWVVWQVDHHQHTADLQWLRVLRALDRFTLMLLLALEWCVKHLFMHETSVKTLVKVELKSENYSYQGSLWNVQWYEDIWDVRNSLLFLWHSFDPCELERIWMLK